MEYRRIPSPSGHGAVGPAPARPASRPEELLTPGEVARLFGVDPKTVTRWAAAGKLTALRTLGGHRRYRASEVHTLLDSTRGGTDAV